jgi:hypothetical protein
LNVKVTLRNPLDKTDLVDYYINVCDNELSRIWFQSLKELLIQKRYLEKNFCFLGFPDSQRNLEFICKELTWAKQQINDFFGPDYQIEEIYTPDALRDPTTLRANQPLLNILHNHFEILQGTVWQLSDYYRRANYETKFAIRQLNNLCHEAESLILSQRKKATLPEWVRPSQITTFLNATRYEFPEHLKTIFDESRYDRRFGEVYLHWTQIGKTLFEVYRDEKGTNIDQATCQAITHLKFYSGEFDIEWGQDVTYLGVHPWYTEEISGFKNWLIRNGFDPADRQYNYGFHPVAQVDLIRSFGTENIQEIWKILSNHLDIYKITADEIELTFDYTWTDSDYYQQQIDRLRPGYDFSSKKYNK